MNAHKLHVAAIGITPPAYKASGGISAGVQLTQRIATLCDASILIMADADSSSVEDGLRITRIAATNSVSSLHSILPRAFVTMMWRADVRGWLREQKPAIVHFHNPHPPGALLDAARACIELNIPYVISTHGFVEFNDFSRGFHVPFWQRPLIKRFIRQPVVEVVQHAARILMLSPLEEPVLRSMGADPRKLDVVSNGVDPYFLEETSDDDNKRLVSRFNLPTGKALMLFVGNHTQNKGLDVLLNAVCRMKGTAVAVIAGAIRSRDEHENLLRSCSVDAGDPRVLFTDFLTKEELRALYRSVDLFVFPSRADTLPLVILEAMASRLPVVSTKVGGIPYEVAPETGILVEPGDADALAVSLDILCADAPLRKAMGAAARKRVCDHFDWQSSARHAVTIYEKVINERFAIAEPGNTVEPANSGVSP